MNKQHIISMLESIGTMFGIALNQFFDWILDFAIVSTAVYIGVVAVHNVVDFWAVTLALMICALLTRSIAYAILGRPGVFDEMLKVLPKDEEIRELRK